MTTASRLKDISKKGLVADQKRLIGGSIYDEYVKGKVFLTSEDGLYYWFNRAIDFIEHLFEPEEYVEKGQIPIVLKINISDTLDITKDDLGTSDSKHPAFVTSKPISPSSIEWFYSESWHPLSKAAHTNFNQGVLVGDDDWDVQLLGAENSPFYPKSHFLNKNKEASKS